MVEGFTMENESLTSAPAIKPTSKRGFLKSPFVYLIIGAALAGASYAEFRLDKLQHQLKPTFTIGTPHVVATINTPWGHDEPTQPEIPLSSARQTAPIIAANTYTRISAQKTIEAAREKTIRKCAVDGKITYQNAPCDNAITP
jgi:hypothetical protein